MFVLPSFVKEFLYIRLDRGNHKKCVFLVARPLRGRGGGKGLATKKKDRFLKKKNSWENVVATKLEA